MRGNRKDGMVTLDYTYSLLHFLHLVIEADSTFFCGKEVFRTRIRRSTGLGPRKAGLGRRTQS